MYIIIRLGVGCVIFIACYLLIKNAHIVRKQRWVLCAFALTAILTAASALVPFENAFVTFSSPESAYNYTHFEPVKLIVNGKKADFAVGEKGDADVYSMVPKTQNGWKIGIGSDIKKAFHTVSEGISVSVYRYKSTDDYFITVFDTNGGTSVITDNHSSVFQVSEKRNDVLNQTFCTYFAYSESFDAQYLLIVDEKQIPVGQLAFSNQ